MARMPGAQWYPKTITGRARRAKGRGIAYHVAVAEAQNLRPGPNADWHFYVARDGTIYQYIDTDYQAWTTGGGNGTMIGVETQGGLYNTETEKWSDAALTSLAKIAAWAHQTEGIPLRLMQSSRPEEKGLGWHKLGVDPWRVSGGELWSSSRGKTCPGAAKIAQMPEVLARAKKLAGASAAGDVTKPTPVPVEDDMTPDQAKQLQYVYDRLTKEEVNGKTLPRAMQDLHRIWCIQEHDRAGTSEAVADDGKYPTARAINMLRWVDGGVEELKELLRQTLDALEPQQPPPAA